MVVFPGISVFFPGDWDHSLSSNDLSGISVQLAELKGSILEVLLLTLAWCLTVSK